MNGPQAQALAQLLTRQFALARLVRGGLIALAAAAVLTAFGPDASMVVLLATGGVWVALSGSGAVTVRLLQAASAHISAERYDLAQRALVAAALRFNVQLAP